jgi:hypothetical protein
MPIVRGSSPQRFVSLVIEYQLLALWADGVVTCWLRGYRTPVSIRCRGQQDGRVCLVSDMGDGSSSGQGGGHNDGCGRAFLAVIEPGPLAVKWGFSAVSSRTLSAISTVRGSRCSREPVIMEPFVGAWPPVFFAFWHRSCGPVKGRGVQGPGAESSRRHCVAVRWLAGKSSRAVRPAAQRRPCPCAQRTAGHNRRARRQINGRWARRVPVQMH